jgi:RecB family exonuclease
LKEAGTNTDPLHFGSYIHKILEDGVNATTMAELTTIAEAERKTYSFAKTYEPKIERCLKNFLRFNATLTETVSTEMVYEVTVDKEKEISLNGIIDRVVKGKDGGYLVIDYKTSKRELKSLDLYQDRQMMGYAYAISQLMNVSLKDITVAHYYPLTNNFVTCKYSSTQISVYLREKIEQVWKIRKMKTDDFVPMVNQFCNWCGYKKYCPKFNPAQVCEERLRTAPTKPRRKKS